MRSHAAHTATEKPLTSSTRALSNSQSNTNVELFNALSARPRDL